jgi:IclR family transcriptional regulator, KDG regulon repressor
MAARNYIAAIERTLRVVESFNGQREVSLGELASRTRMIKSSVFRILYTLGQLGYVEKDAKGRYSLTPRWENLCLGAQPTRELIRISAPLMAVLLDRYKETVNLGVTDGGDVLYIHVIESPHAFRLAAHAGMRSPLYSTALGKCLLSHLSPQEVDGILKKHPIQELTPHTVRNAAAFKRDLGRVRTQGHAVDNGEDSLGARCVAAPIFNAAGEVVAAISISGPAGRITPRRDREMAKSLMDTCRRISTTLRYAALPTKPSAAGGH